MKEPLPIKISSTFDAQWDPFFRALAEILGAMLGRMKEARLVRGLNHCGGTA